MNNRFLEYSENKETIDVKTLRNFGELLFLSNLSNLNFNANEKLKFEDFLFPLEHA